MVRKLQIALLAIAAAGLLRVKDGNSPETFYVPAPILAKGEAQVNGVMGLQGKRLELRDLEAWQQENAALKRKMGSEPAGDFLRVQDLPRWATLEMDGRAFLIWPADDGIDLKEELAAMFGRYARETMIILCWSFAALLLALVVIFGKRFLGYALPIAAAELATVGTLGWLGEGISFFNLICLVVLAGIGIDYTIFQRSRKKTPRTEKVVLCSFLTSFVGFGLLAFTSFPVMRSVGLTLGLGLLFAYLFAWGGERGNSKEEVSWQNRPEQLAGTRRIAFMFWLLRNFGRTPAKILAAAIAAFAYPFIKVPRKSLAKVRNFAWALVDKAAAVSGCGKDLRFEVTGDTGWMKGGCFLLSTHVGCVEVMPAMPNEKGVVVHAFQQMRHNAVYTRQFLKNMTSSHFVLHAVEDIGVETAVEMQEAISKGDIVLMAGDRSSAQSGKKGVFRFAKLMECDVYAIVCVRDDWNGYVVEARKLGSDIAAEYDAFLQKQVARHPDEWFEWG